MKTPVTKTVKAKYIGPETKALDKEQEYELVVMTNSLNPGVEITTDAGKTSIGYPSKKKYLEHWEEVEKGKVVKMPMPDRARKVKESQISIADAGAVIYTELVAAINRFNAKSAETYKDKPGTAPLFTLNLQKQIYDDATRTKTRLYGAGVLLLSVKQFGLSRIIYQQGVSLPTEKELDNVNAYAPKLYIDCMNSFVESALLYILALNPDNPENVQALKDAESQEISAPGN